MLLYLLVPDVLCVNEALALRSLCDSSRRVKVLNDARSWAVRPSLALPPWGSLAKTYVEGQPLPVNMFAELCLSLFSSTYMPITFLHQSLFIISAFLSLPRLFMMFSRVSFWFWGLYSANENLSLGLLMQDEPQQVHKQRQIFWLFRHLCWWVLISLAW